VDNGLITGNEEDALVPDDWIADKCGLGATGGRDEVPLVLCDCPAAIGKGVLLGSGAISSACKVLCVLGTVGNVLVCLIVLDAAPRGDAGATDKVGLVDVLLVKLGKAC
jgi:hypothetical protein